jgi:hypothetical protein
MIDAGKFAKPTKPVTGDPGFFRFSIDREGAVAELRRIADAIEDGRFHLQKVQSGTVAVYDDFCFQALMIEFAEREVVEALDRAKPVAGNKVALTGRSAFPIDVQTVPER